MDGKDINEKLALRANLGGFVMKLCCINKRDTENGNYIIFSAVLKGKVKLTPEEFNDVHDVLCVQKSNPRMALMDIWCKSSIFFAPLKSVAPH
jgi:hypothetical protein